MKKNKKDEFKIEIIENNNMKKEFIKKPPEIKRSKITFKCPVCKELIIFKFEIPNNIKRFPYRVEYLHKNHIILIDIDNNYEIRELKPK